MNAERTMIGRLLPRGSRASLQRGLTLVELAIAMTIALFLLAGLLTIVSGLKSTWRTQNQLAQLQDGERIAMTMLTDVIQTAGYWPDPKDVNAGDVFTGAAPFGTPGQSVVGTSTSAGPDTITVQYAVGPGDNIINCQGGTNLAGGASPYALYVNTFSVDTANQVLECALNGGDAVPLVSGVQNMKVWYGVNTGGSSSCNTDSYLRASEVAAANQWTNVCSIKVQLTFTNPTNTATPVQFSRVIAVLGSTG